MVYLQGDTKLSRCHVICYSAEYNLLQNLQIPKSGGGEYEIRCMISAYNAESKEARCYLELVEKVREKKLEDSMTAMGAKLAGPPTTFSAKQAGQKSSYDDECAASLFSVHQDSNKPGWTLVERGTPSVEPREMVRARAGDAVAREHEDLLVEKRVMLENPEAFEQGGAVLGKQKAVDGGADCGRSGKRSKPGMVSRFLDEVQELEFRADVLQTRNSVLEAEKLELVAGAVGLQTRNSALEAEKLELAAGAVGLQTRNSALEAEKLELVKTNGFLAAQNASLRVRVGKLRSAAMGKLREVMNTLQNGLNESDGAGEVFGRLPDTGLIVMGDISCIRKTWVVRYRIVPGAVQVTNDELMHAYTALRPKGYKIVPAGNIGYALCRHVGRCSAGKLMSIFNSHFGTNCFVEVLDPACCNTVVCPEQKHTAWRQKLFNLFVAKILQMQVAGGV